MPEDTVCGTDRLHVLLRAPRKQPPGIRNFTALLSLAFKLHLWIYMHLIYQGSKTPVQYS